MKYRVLKDYVGRLGALVKAGEIIWENNLADNLLLRGLLKHGFVERIEEEEWKPKEGSIYSYWTDGGLVKSSRWVGCTEDLNRLDIGNCYKNAILASKDYAWAKAFKVLRDDMKGYRPSWGDSNEFNYYVDYCIAAEEFVVCYEINHISHIICFATEEEAQKSIQEHEEEWRIVLGLKEVECE